MTLLPLHFPLFFLTLMPFAVISQLDQRSTLLKLKRELGDPPSLRQWNDTSSPCDWSEITCVAGNVTKISFYNQNFTVKVPTTICDFPNLGSLNLSYNNFSGEFPTVLYNCLKLQYLDLSQNLFNGTLPADIDRLSRELEYLDLAANGFSGDIPKKIGLLSKLKVLNLYQSEYNGTFPSEIGDLSELEELRLAYNDKFLPAEIPTAFVKLKKLKYLWLTQMNLIGEIPAVVFGNMTDLEHVDLAANKLSGRIPDVLFGLKNLTDLYLFANDLIGEIPKSISATNMVELDLSANNLTGSIPEAIGNLTRLEILNLFNNQLTGEIPSAIGKLPGLKELKLFTNKLTGVIPAEIGFYSKLERFEVSENQLTGKLPENLCKGGKLLGVVVFSNNLTGEIPESLGNCGTLLIVYLQNNGFSGEIPEMITIKRLDISNNKIKGQVPGWLWTLPNLEQVNLSNNTLTSFERPTKHGLSSSLDYLSASKNNFTGNIPSFICAFNSLRILDLSENNFNGSIPPCMRNLKNTLSTLNLRQNRLSGGLPENVFIRLRSLDVGHNQLVGKLPRSLIRFTALEILNVESNKINYTFPFWLSTLQNLQVLILRSNAFHGPIHQASFLQLKIMDISHNHFSGILPSDYFVNWSKMSSLGTEEDRSNVTYMGDSKGYYHDSMVLMIKGVSLELVRIIRIYTALDFSGNRLEGEIPRSIGLLKELHVLNLSNNAFTGHIPSSMGNLTALESLDFSLNNLSGEIPQELGNLSYLAYMNFSHNQLVGLVPGGTQFRTQPCSSFQDNSGLFGPALDKDCRDIHTPSSQQYETPEAEEEDEEMFSWIAAAIGFVPGIVFGLTIGYILVFYKPRWFTSPFGRNKHRSRNTTTH